MIYLAATLGALALWGYAFYSHPEARLLLAVTMLLGIGMVLSPVILCRPINHRELQRLEAHAKEVRGRAREEEAA